METKTLKDLKDDILNTSSTAQPVKIYAKCWAKVQDCNSNIGEMIKNGDFLITRDEIFNIQDNELRAIKCLMWGYPNLYNMQKNIKIILKDENWKKLISLLGENKGKNLSEQEFATFFHNIESIDKLGPSTRSKLLYFFEISVNGNPCLVFDEQLRLYLNNKPVTEIVEHPNFGKWNHAKLDHYIDYIKQMKIWADSLEIPCSKLELYFFIDQHRK